MEKDQKKLIRFVRRHFQSLIFAAVIGLTVSYVRILGYPSFLPFANHSSNPTQLKTSRLPHDMLKDAMILEQPLPYPQTDVYKIRDGTIELRNFTHTCSPNDLLQVRQSRTTNATSLVPTASKTACPRKLGAGSSRLPSTALATFPGSGNTWMRHILQQLTGIYTGAIYDDKSLLLRGFPFEGRVRNVIAVKTHGAIHKHLPKYQPIGRFDRVLVVMRNIYESFLAQYKFQNYQNHTANPCINTTSSTWKATFGRLLKWWETYMSDIFSYTGPILIVYYEDLKNDLLPQLVRIADFMRASEVTDFSFCCVVKQSEGNFHRKQATQTINDVFDVSHRKIVNSLIEKSVAKLPRKFKELSDRLRDYKLPVSLAG